MKTAGSVVSLVGGVLALFASIMHFFVGGVASGMAQNETDAAVGGGIALIGIVSFLIAIAIVILAGLSFREKVSKGLFIAIIVLGGVLIIMTVFVSGIITLIGGILGTVGVVKACSNGQSRTNIPDQTEK
ncbi:MAG: hypothetical protein ACO2ZM_04085 [Francisellaceae bacterium]